VEPHTGVSVLVAGLALVESTVKGWREVVVKVLSAAQQAVVLGAAKVLVGADRGSTATGGGLQPSIVLAARAARNKRDRNQLVSIERSGHVGAIAQRLTTEALTNWWVQTLEETSGRVLENSVGRSRDGELRVLDDVGVHAADWVASIGGDPAVAVVVTRSPDLGVTKIGQVSRRP